MKLEVSPRGSRARARVGRSRSRVSVFSQYSELLTYTSECPRVVSRVEIPRVVALWSNQKR